jgi:hypothetical protein
LTAATLAVLVGGYGRLGSVVGGALALWSVPLRG